MAGCPGAGFGVGIEFGFGLEEGPEGVGRGADTGCNCGANEEIGGAFGEGKLWGAESAVIAERRRAEGET